MADVYRKRRTIILFIIVFGIFGFFIFGMQNKGAQVSDSKSSNVLGSSSQNLAINALKLIAVKGRAPKTGYVRAEFGSGWATQSGCDTRNIILNRDLTKVSIDKDCNVISGILNDPYTGKVISFKRGAGTSSQIQIDHVVSLSDAWQKGAQALSKEKRTELANDPLELLAVDGKANQDKSDGDAATWLPPNKSFRCQYVARQIAVKIKYSLWMTNAEYNVVKNILSKCPNQALPTK